jgi:hypothetical protein
MISTREHLKHKLFQMFLPLLQPQMPVREEKEERKILRQPRVPQRLTLQLQSRFILRR